MQLDDSTYKPTRRRTLGILASAVAVTSAGVSAGVSMAALVPPTRAFTWRGTALGADATLTLCHHDRAEAQAAIDACLLEIERLEQEFSLYRSDSALSRLNRDGILPSPSLDMIALLRAGRQLGDITDGRFDYTIQPLWLALGQALGQASGRALAAQRDDVEAARKTVDYRRVEIAPDLIRLGEAQQITLNGIAQGYITDRITQLLMARGWTDVRVNLGETRVLGRDDQGAPWRVGLDGAGIDLNMTSGAIAVSAADALSFGGVGDNHLIDPVTGDSLPAGRSIAVRADSATVADGLSTVLGFIPTDKWTEILVKMRARDAWLISPDAAVFHVVA